MIKCVVYLGKREGGGISEYRLCEVSVSAIPGYSTAKTKIVSYKKLMYSKKAILNFSAMVH